MNNNDEGKRARLILVPLAAVITLFSCIVMTESVIDGIFYFSLIALGTALMAIALRALQRYTKLPFWGEGSVKGHYPKIKNWNPEVKNATLTLNGKFAPELRKKFEQSIDEILKNNKIGVVLGGKCIYKERKEAEACEIYLSLRYDAPGFISDISAYLEQVLNIPRGSMLEGPHGYKALGQLSGISVYLDVTDLPIEEVKEDYSSMLKEIGETFKGKRCLFDMWEATVEDNPDFAHIKTHMVGLFYYSDDYEYMKSSIEPIVQKTVFAEVYKIVRCA